VEYKGKGKRQAEAPRSCFFTGSGSKSVIFKEQFRQQNKDAVEIRQFLLLLRQFPWK
jgi:hypothetical protein